nr:cytochrome c peroxidase [Solimonas terrae]
MRLFYSKSLGGNFDSACVSCHHPDLGGGDRLSLPVGVAAIDADLLGPGREAADGVLRVGRNAPTTFNAALADRALFDDGRVESLNPQPGANGAGGGIRTPDSAFGVADPNAGSTLPAAQSRFPIVTPEEMLGTLLPNADHDTVRTHLAQRIGGYGAAAGELARNNWLPLFQSAFGIAGNARSLVTDASIATAIGAYERSQLFVDTDWRRYVEGDLTAISDAAKRGATLFLTPANQGGAGCNACHRGDLFSDQNFHTVAFPQIGPGKGDGANGDDDFGRERESGNATDQYAYRTPSLLNVALSAPYGHAGAYATLTDVVNHYRNPRGSVANYVNQHDWCVLSQFADLSTASCNALFPDAAANSNAALAKLQADRNAGRLSIPNIQISDGDVADIVAFLNTLTDRCAADASCRARWIPPRDGGPDGEQLDAVDVNGNPL